MTNPKKFVHVIWVRQGIVINDTDINIKKKLKSYDRMFASAAIELEFDGYSVASYTTEGDLTQKYSRGDITELGEPPNHVDFKETK